MMGCHAGHLARQTLDKSLCEPLHPNRLLQSSSTAHIGGPVDLRQP